MYFPISEYARIFAITPEIYNLQIERLEFGQKVLSGLVNQTSEKEQEFLIGIFGHLSQLITDKRIKKDSQKQPGWKPVCLYGFDSKGKEDCWYGEEDSIGSSIVVDVWPSDETRAGSQKIVHSLMPEAGVDIFDKERLLERLSHFKRIGFSGGRHRHDSQKYFPETKCDSDRCLAGEHFLPTMIPAVLLYIEIGKLDGDYHVKEVSVVFADSEYQDN